MSKRKLGLIAAMTSGGYSLLWQGVGLFGLYPHRANRSSITTKELFANEALFRPISQIVRDGSNWFDKGFLNPKDFQGPVRVSRSYLATFKFTRLVEISNIYIGGKLFFGKPERSFVFRRRIREDFLLFDCFVGFLSSLTSFFVV